MDLKRRDEAENKERNKDKKVMKQRKENDIPQVSTRSTNTNKLGIRLYNSGLHKMEWFTPGIFSVHPSPAFHAPNPP